MCNEPETEEISADIQPGAEAEADGDDATNSEPSDVGGGNYEVWILTEDG